MKKFILSIIGYLMLISKVSAATTTSNNVTLQNPLKTDNLPQLIGYILKGLLGVVGSVSLIMFIYGGILWLTSGGNTDSIKKGKNTIIWAIMGLVIIFSAYAILRFVFTILTF